jgi:N-acetylmuramoyl-L-alanine amidase
MIRNLSQLVIAIGLIWADNLVAIQITKIFHHEGQCENKLALYFDANPKLTQSSGANFQEYRLLNTSLSVAAQAQLIAALQKQSGCQVIMRSEGSDFLIRITFNPKQISKVTAAKFKTVSSFDGLTIKIVRAGKRRARGCELKAGAKLVVLDFGHGGKDPGAQANGVTEKQVVQQVGLRLQSALEAAGYTVKLTRSDDSFIALDQRTALANLDTGANLFISLHANFSSNSNAQGVETYYLHSDQLQPVELDQIGHQKLDQHSQKLAELIHQNILNGVQPTPEDRRVRQTVSQVLLGAEMPAVLVELGYLSNPQEAARLNTPAYQAQLARAITRGVQDYFRPIS